MNSTLDVIYNFDVVNYLLFLFVSYSIYNSYEPLKLYLNASEKFRKYDQNKQYYIIKNLIKTVAMSFIFVFLISVFIPNVLNGIWIDSHNRIIGAFYVGNDLAGLFAVPNLPQSTKFHHYTSVSLYTLICILSTEKEDNIARLVVIYTIFSCIPYLVNSYLALRFFYNRGDTLSEYQKKQNKILDVNRVLAYYTYYVCCVCNWLYHLYFILNKIIYFDLSISYIIYYLLLIPIVNDDIVLLSWLKNKNLEL
jgi:hypothetical protein